MTTPTKAYVDLPNATYAPVNAALVFTPGLTVAVNLTVTPVAAISVTAGTILRFTNPGAELVYLLFGGNTVASDLTASNSLDLVAGAVECFTVPFGITKMSMRAAANTATVKYTVGLGA